MKNKSLFRLSGRHIGLYEGQSVKIFSRILTLFLFFFLIAGFSGKVAGANSNSAGTNTQLVVYPAPDGYTPSPNYTMTVNAKPVAVYDARIRNTWTGSDNNCAYTYFDFEGTVHVKVTVASGLQSVKIRPLSAGITATVKGNAIEFDMALQRKLSIEINGNIQYPLFLFANPVEVNTPNPSDAGVRYFGPGIHDAGKIEVKSNETIYIAGGAIVKGYFTAENAENIKITGRGIMDAHENNSSMIRMTGCRNVIVEGIIIADQPAWNWTVSYWSCDSIVLKNIKLMGGDDYSNDGIDIVSCQDFTVDDCFVYCFDDCIAIKAERSKRRPVKDVTILNSLFWNIQAYGFVIGAELDAPSVSQVLVKNCDYIHSQQIEDPNDAYYFYSGTLGIFNGGDCDVHDIRFEDIRVEDAKAKLISLKVMKSMSWNSKNVKFGKIHDIYFKNVSIADGIFIPSEIISENAYSKFIEGTENNYLEDNNIIQNITFENLWILGKQILNPYEGGFVVNPCTLNMRFIENIDE